MLYVLSTMQYHYCVYYYIPFVPFSTWFGWTAQDSRNCCKMILNLHVSSVKCLISKAELSSVKFNSIPPTGMHVVWSAVKCQCQQYQCYLKTIHFHQLQQHCIKPVMFAITTNRNMELWLYNQYPSLDLCFNKELRILYLKQ